MKKGIIFLSLLVLLLSACSKKENNQTNENVNQGKRINTEKNVNKDQEKNKEYVYVNALSGLRIRKDSNAESEKIGSLKNKEKVELISKTTEPVEIDGISSVWYEIKTEDGIQGFAFGGYLENFLSNVEIIQAVEGDYWDEEDSENITIVNKGNGMLLVTTNIPIFSESQKTIEVQRIYRSDLFEYTQDGRGGLSETFTVKFNDDMKLVLQDDRYELINMFEEDEYEEETHTTTVFIKK